MEKQGIYLIMLNYIKLFRGFLFCVFRCGYLLVLIN